jgi:hypothetical protein
VFQFLKSIIFRHIAIQFVNHKQATLVIYYRDDAAEDDGNYCRCNCLCLGDCNEKLTYSFNRCRGAGSTLFPTPQISGASKAK